MTGRFDHDLLFGYLALTLDFINENQFLESMRNRVNRTDSSLANILVELKSLTVPQRLLIEQLAEEYRSVHADDSATSLPLVSSSTQRVTSQLAGLDEELDATLSSFETPTPLDGTPPLPGSLPLDASDARAATARYQVLRPHEKGGMGEVFVALDQQLDREVALKEMQSKFAYDAAGQLRFRREAEITGKLEHPGVVPIYSLERHDDGRPYYAMRFIHGRSLHDEVGVYHAEQKDQPPAQRTRALRALLRRFIDVCNAVEYAHSRGVLHRDLKPSNIMLGQFGETLVVDWGLAKRMDAGPSAAVAPSGQLSSAEFTVAGQAIGTPAYMSPEQAEGELNQLGPASDVYSLGATLYFILTGRSPFRGGDDLLERVRRGEFAHPHEVGRDVPRALEAACLKAMRVERSQRYATPRELAEEIESYLADEPVKAWREPLLERCHRWARRHRTAVTSSVAVLLVTAVLLAVGTWRLSLANDEVEFQRSQAVQRADEAVEMRTMAHQAVEDYLTEVSESRLLAEKGMQPLRRRLMQHAEAYYQRFADNYPDEPNYRRELMEAWMALGQIHDELGDARASLAAWSKAEQVGRQLQSTADAPPELRWKQGVCLRSQAVAHRALGDTQQALNAYDRARRAFDKARQATQKAARQTAQFELARTLVSEAVLQESIGDRDKSLALYEQSTKYFEESAKDNPNGANALHSLAVVRQNIGKLKKGEGSAQLAIDAYRHAMKDLEKIPERERDSAKVRYTAATIRGNLANALASQAQVQPAFQEFENALQLATQLTREEPFVADYQDEVARTLLNRGALYYGLDDKERAAADFSAAADAYGRIVATHPDDTSYLNGQAIALSNLAVVQQELGQSEDAAKTTARSLTIRRQLADLQTDVLSAQVGLATTLENAAGALEDPAAALPLYDEAIQRLRFVLQRDPKHAEARQFLKDAILGKSRSLAHGGQYEQAAADARTLITDHQLTNAELFNTACVFTLCAKAAHEDENLQESERAERMTAYRNTVIAILKPLQEAGYFEGAAARAALKNNDDLEFLRADVLRELGLD